MDETWPSSRGPVLPAVPSPAGVVRAVWTFFPRPRSRTGREDATRLRAGLESALRAGHGAGVRFRLCLVGGPDCSLQLTVDDAASERWVERALLAAYDPGDWCREPCPPRTGPRARWSGHRRGLPEERPGLPPETGRLCRALVAALRAGRPGVAMSVSLRPAPSPRWRLLESWWPAEAPARTERPARQAVPGPSPPAHEAPVLAWSAAIDLWTEALPTSVDTGPTLASVRSAWTALDGRPLVLRRSSGSRAEAFRSLLAEGEVPALLPSWDGEHGGNWGRCGLFGGIPLGRTGSGSVVRLPVEDGQGRHFALLGETGMGKSSLLVTVALRAARLGGLVVLDPLGETAATIQDELRAAGRDVIWVAPGAPGVGLNALAGISAALTTDPVRAERELEDLVHALRRVRAGRYADAPYWGPRLEEMLVRAVRAASFLPGGTLEDAHALLAGAGRGRSIVPPGAQAEAQELAARVRERPDDAEGARRLLYEIARNPMLVRMLCARVPDISVERMVAGGRIVLVSGTASRVGESTARYLLAAYLALVWSELLARELPEKTFVLLDEAQWFAHEGLAEMLRLARRRNVHVGVATQSLTSLSEVVQDAVRTNVADLVVFRGSPAQAGELARTAAGVSPEAILGLGRGEALVLLGKGEAVRWARTARLPGRTPPDPQLPSPAPDAEALNVDPGPLPAPVEPATMGGPMVPPPARPEVEILVGLCARAQGLAPGALLEVDLDELRDGVPARAEALRTLGGELGRRGALLRHERRGGRAVWWLEPAGLARALADRTEGPGTAAADSPKRL